MPNKDVYRRRLCSKLWARKMRQSVSAYLLYYRETHPCVGCGETHPDLLEFHHIDPRTKKFNVGGSRFHNLKVVKEEINKCVMLCIKCHKRITRTQKRNGQLVQPKSQVDEDLQLSFDLADPDEIEMLSKLVSAFQTVLRTAYYT